MSKYLNKYPKCLNININWQHILGKYPKCLNINILIGIEEMSSISKYQKLCRLATNSEQNSPISNYP